MDELGVFRASVPPLPVGFRHTDFDENLGNPESQNGEDDEDHSNEDPSHDYCDDDLSNDDEHDVVRGDDVPIPDTPVFYQHTVQ